MELIVADTPSLLYRREGVSVCKSALDTAAGDTGNNFLGHKDVQEEGGKEDDENSCEHCAVLTGILHGVDDLQQTHTNGHHLIGSSEDQSHEELIPHRHKVEDGNGNDCRLHQRQHDFPEGLGMAASIQIGSFFIGFGEC